MPTGPKGQKRPADVIGNAVKVSRKARPTQCRDRAQGQGMLSKAQRELVVNAVARLPQTDREHVLIALWARLPPRFTDDVLIDALTEAIEAETTGARDQDGLIIPVIRSCMSVQDAAEVYHRMLKADGPPPTPEQEAAMRTRYTSEQLVELYVQSLKGSMRPSERRA